MSEYSKKMASCEFDKKADTNEMEEDGEKYQLVEFCRFLIEHFEVAKKWQAFQDFLEKHPVASVFLLVTSAMCSVPMVLFSIFVMTSVAFSIMGFFLFEGTVIAIATFILGVVLFFVGLFSIGFSLFLISSYYALQMSGSIISRLRDKLAVNPFMTDDREKEE